VVNFRLAQPPFNDQFSISTTRENAGGTAKRIKSFALELYVYKRFAT